MSLRSRTGPAALRRWAFFFSGVAAAAVGFVGLVNAENHGHGRSPWWIVALFGIGAVLVGLGTPWGAQSLDD